MNDLLATIAIAGITNASVLALFIWVFKVSFEKALDKRAKLYEREIDLAHKKAFHQFSKVYDEQAATLRDVYAQLVSLNDLAAHLAYHHQLLDQYPQLLERYRLPESGDARAWDRFLRASLSEKPENLKADALWKEASRVLSGFRSKRIYLPAATAGEVERLLNLFLYVGSEFQNVSYRDPKDLQPVVAPEVLEAWQKALGASQALFPMLEEQFRTHLQNEG